MITVLFPISAILNPLGKGTERIKNYKNMKKFFSQ